MALCGGENNCSIIRFLSYKLHLVTRSAIASEFHNLSDAFGYEFMMKYDLEIIMSQTILFQMLTDSLPLFGVII